MSDQLQQKETTAEDLNSESYDDFVDAAHPDYTFASNDQTHLWTSTNLSNNLLVDLSSSADPLWDNSGNGQPSLDNPKWNKTGISRPEKDRKASANKASKSLGKATSVQLAPQNFQLRDPNTDSHSINELYHYTVRTFARFCPLIECSQCLQSRMDVLLERQLSLMYMWAQGLDLKFLQAAVDQSTQLQVAVLRELVGIVKSVQVLSDAREWNSEDDLMVHSIDDFIRSSSKANMENESESDSSSAESNETDDAVESDRGSRSKLNHFGHVTSIRRLKMHVRCLMDLLPTLVHCCDEERAKAGHREAVASNENSQAFQVIQPYAIQVRDKFPSIDVDLATRLAEANWSRFKRLQKLAAMNRAQQEDLEFDNGSSSEEEELEAVTFRPISEFYDSGLGSSLPAKSRFNPSVASHTSFLSTGSSVTRGAVRVPPTPAEVKQGVPFACSICGLTQSHVRNRIDWKMHVFHDIQPYICTFRDCKDSRLTFPTRTQWAEHEFEQHRSREVWRCFECGHNSNSSDMLSTHLRAKHAGKAPATTFEMKAVVEAAKTCVVNLADQNCPMCPQTSFNTRREWATHVGKHMEEVALIVLPRTNDSDEEDKEDNSSKTDDLSRQSFAKTQNLFGMGIPTYGLYLDPLQSDGSEVAPRPDSPQGLLSPIVATPDEKDSGFYENPEADVATNMAFPETSSSIFAPTARNFETRIRQLNPRTEWYLADRIAQDQVRTFERLMKYDADHRKYTSGVGERCPSGELCSWLGGKAKLIPPRTDANHVQFKVGSVGDSDAEEALFMDGVVTPALFPTGIPLPPTTHLPAEFECPLCFQVKKISKPSDWTKHVHEDVQPYSCTFPNCREPKSFKRKADWVRHENERHRHLEWWRCSISECHHICYRVDNFVQHLVREHKMTEPKDRTSLTHRRFAQTDRAQREDTDFRQLVKNCRQETVTSPRQEPCKFCNNICSTWKKLSVHVGKHMEQIAMPILEIVERERSQAAKPETQAGS